MKLLIISTLLLAQVSFTYAQNCRAYIPYDKGTKTELTNYNKKGKVEGIISQEITEVEHTGDNSIFSMHQKVIDPKSNDVTFENDMTFRCEGGTFYIDMNGYLDQKQMEAYSDMEVKLSMDEMDIPSSYTAGQKLKDGKIEMEVIGGPMPIRMLVSIINRKVEGEEQLTTPAGTFDCVKISQDIVTKSIITMTISSVEWYAEGVGVVRSETLRKGKLTGYSELTKFIKP